MDLKFLDIAIGTILIYLLLSLFASTIMELVATLFQFRAGTLEKAVKKMLDDGSEAAISNAFYKSTTIKYLGDTTLFGNDKKPSYLMPNNFSKTVLDIIINKSSGKTMSLADIQSGLSQLKTDVPDSKESVEYIESLLRDAGNDIDKLRAGLELWFNDTMDRANGWYKEKIRYFLLIIGVAIAIVFNADTFQMIKYLNDNPKQRGEMVELAKAYIQKHDAEKKDSTHVTAADSSDALVKAESLLKTADDQQKKIATECAGALGWNDGILVGLQTQTGIKKIFGFLLTALAISLGSNFWFDSLKKLVSIRGAGVNPDEKKDKNTA